MEPRPGLYAIRRRGLEGPWQFVESSLEGPALDHRAAAVIGGPVERRAVRWFGCPRAEFSLWTMGLETSVCFWPSDWAYRASWGGWHAWDEPRPEPPGAPETVDQVAVAVETIDAGWLSLSIEAGAAAYRFTPSSDRDPSASTLRWLTAIAGGGSPFLVVDCEDEYTLIEVFGRGNGQVRLHVTDVDDHRVPNVVTTVLDVLIDRHRLVASVYRCLVDLQSNRRNRKLRRQWITGDALVRFRSTVLDDHVAGHADDRR